MLKKRLMLLFAICLLFSPLYTASSIVQLSASANLTTTLESQIIGKLNGTNAYCYNQHLEKIAFNHSLSNYSFRSAGSSGANATADWIIEQFSSFGLEAYKEPFLFTNWDVLDKPILIVDNDGNSSTTDDQTILGSFQCVHYSWPTPSGGLFSDLVILPLPPAANSYEIGVNPINTTEWNAIDTTGKILLIGREVRWNFAWEEIYKDKLTAQTPLAVIYTWWYDWMSFTPPVFYSAGGRPGRTFGSYYWDLEIPVGFVSYDDGLQIRNKENNDNVYAQIEIDTIIGYGPHYNIIGKLAGYKYPDKFVIVSSHYDTVMCSGFCDNGAGTAGIIELARILAETDSTGLFHPKYTILFIVFASEEIGVVGSVNYIMQHEEEISDIVAVINLDGIGSDDLYVSETNPGPEFDLNKLVLDAASDLGVNTTLEGNGVSDDIVFKNPEYAEWLYSWFWGLTAGIADVNPVESSIGLISYPLTWRDLWNIGTPGWIHTSYDNSTSTNTFNWVETDDLKDHLKVAALSLMRIVHLKGDINGDKWVNAKDAIILGVIFNSEFGDDDYNVDADFNSDDRINAKDAVILGNNFGEHWE